MNPVSQAIEVLSQPWPWWFTGIAIAFCMGLLLYLGKTFGVSSTLRTMCSIGGAGKKVSFFNFNWKGELWNLVFVLGGAIGGFIAVNFMMPEQAVHLSDVAVEEISAMGIDVDQSQFLPTELFSWEALLTPRGAILLIVGGFLVGFGTRYAGGCTSGHAISGLSNLQLPSLIAVVGFFIGGLVMTHLIFPLLF